MIKGKLKKTNSCDVNVNKNGIFDVGVIEVNERLKESGGVFASKNFKAIVKCEYPSAVILSLSSSRGTDYPTNRKHFSRTKIDPTGPIVYKTNFVLETGTRLTSPTANGLLNVGTKNGLNYLGAKNAVASLNGHSGNTRTYISSNPSYKNILIFRKNNRFSMEKKYVLPFKIELESAPMRNWINKMKSGHLNLKENITIKSYII